MFLKMLGRLMGFATSKRESTKKSNEDGTFPRQTNPPLVDVFFDPDTGKYYEATLICSCDTPVYGLPERHFFCKHCDLPCEEAPCATCWGYNRNIDERLQWLEDEGLD